MVVTDADGPGARILMRSVDDDMFRFGSAEAYRLGYDAAIAELRDGDQTSSSRVKQQQD
ncbi:MAG: hypothetical protein MO852_08390 [Candidatus Devosia euplotis]|nr:hypothetical protein [Candidatus Devosia euplotis]